MTDELMATQIVPQGPIGGDNIAGNWQRLSSEDSAATEVDATKRRTEITIETERIWMVSHRKVSSIAWCEGCCWRVRMIGPEEAAVWSGTSTRTIYRWIEDNRVHFVERPDGVLLVCVRSLKHILAQAARETTEDYDGKWNGN